MVCYDFKGGIGTSSRIANIGDETFTVGTLVQANYGKCNQLVINGHRIGEELEARNVPRREDPVN